MFANRLSSGALAVFLALLVAPAAAAPATLSVSRSGDEIVVVATAEVAADEATAWDVLTGYDRLPDFIPDMSASRTLEREGSNALVSQSGRAGLGPFKQAFSLTLAVHGRQQTVTARRRRRFQAVRIEHARTAGVGHTRTNTRRRTDGRDPAAGRIAVMQRDPRPIEACWPRSTGAHNWAPVPMPVEISGSHGCGAIADRSPRHG
jgi:hypothetical protein